MSIIECVELTKTYRGAKALNKISFKIEDNKITGVIGRNGAGKTTLLKIIAGFLKKSSGEINVFSEQPFNNLTVSANTIFIDDYMNLPSSLNLKEILETAASFYPNWNAELADRLFDYFSFKSTQYHTDLSKGMKSTFNMILGISARCPLTIFDEPTTGMDAAVRKDFYRALLRDYIANPRTILISSHHLNEIEDLIEDVLLIKDGHTHLHIPIADLKEMAVGLKGKNTVLHDWTKNKEIYHSKSLSNDLSYVVVKNDFSETDLQKARQEGVDISPITSSDLCVYITSKTKGGIDDVFNESEIK